MTKIWTTLPNERIGMRGTFWLPALIALVAALGTAHILVRTSTYGAALTNDSLNYLSAAESLAAGEGLLSYDGGQMVLFAPFFPVAMAFLSLFGIEPVDGGRFLNATAFGLLILVSGLWLRRRLRVQPIALGAATAIMVALPLAHSASTLRSEPLFILFTLLTLLPLESFLNRRSGKPALALSAVFAALAAVHEGCAHHLRSPHAPCAPERPGRRAVEACFGLRHHPVAPAGGGDGAQPTGLRNPHGGQVLSVWTVPVRFAGPDRRGVPRVASVLSPAYHWQLPHSPWLLAGLLLLLAALLLVTPRPGRASSVFRVFALMYLAIIAVVVPFTVHQGIDSRYLAPVYVPLLFVAAFWLDALLRSKPSGRMSMGRWALSCLSAAPGISASRRGRICD